MLTLENSDLTTRSPEMYQMNTALEVGISKMSNWTKTRLKVCSHASRSVRLYLGTAVL